MENAETFLVEVAYAKRDEQVLLTVKVPEGTTVKEAVERSGIADRFPEINLAKARMGIFGKVAKADAVLREGDRVEIYRPLIADPKEVRKKRAAEGKQLKKGARAAGEDDSGADDE